MGVLLMSENKPKNERLEKMLAEHKDDPEATAILKSNWMQRLMAEVEDKGENE